MNPGADSGPLYSPDGKYIGYRAQFRAGYESDRWRLLVLERATGKVTNLTENMDRWVSGFTWSPDSSKLFFTSEDRGRQPIQYIPVTGGGSRIAVSGDNHLDDMQLTRDGKKIVYTMQSGSQPVEIYRGAAVRRPGRRAHASERRGAQCASTHAARGFLGGGRGEGAGAELPREAAGFRSASRNIPSLMLIHGGPQGAWGQDWSYRWNAQVFAARGLRGGDAESARLDRLRAEIHRRDQRRLGRPRLRRHHGRRRPHGHAFPTPISAAWPRPAASYGGYMVDWILGHTQRFKALVSHAGVYDLRSEFGATEELWFPLWEFKGTPWDNPEMYVRWSPSQFVKEFHTPTLVIHGELDFRVPYTQGLQLFTALQLQKVPSKLLHLSRRGPLDPEAAEQPALVQTFIDWIDSWTKK